MKENNEIETIQFCGIKLVNCNKDDFATFAIEKAKEKKGYISFSLNGESLAKYHNDSSFSKLFDHSDFVHADGMSIVTASRIICKKGLSERIATTDWFHNVAKQSLSKNVSHYLLGASPKSLEKTIKAVKELYPDLNIVGSHHGYFDNNEFDEIIIDINDKKPDFIWIGLGRPRQELSAIAIKERCEVGIIKTCGGLFNFLAGENKRAPKLMQALGIEWLFRLSLEPKRLFKRYLITNYQSIKIFLEYWIRPNTGVVREK